MKVRLKKPYTGAAGRYEAGALVGSGQVPKAALEHMVAVGVAEAVGVQKVERAVAAVPETADIKQQEKAPGFPCHTGGGWWLLSSGKKVRGEAKAREAEAGL